MCVWGGHLCESGGLHTYLEEDTHPRRSAKVPVTTNNKVGMDLQFQSMMLPWWGGYNIGRLTGREAGVRDSHWMLWSLGWMSEPSSSEL